MKLFAQSIIGPLNVVHGVVAFVLFVAILMACIFTFAVGASNWKHVVISSTTAAAAFLLTVLGGWIIYPVFHIDVRAAYLDASHPAIAGLFTIKEHLAAVGAFVALGVLVLGLFGRLQTASSFRRQLFGGLLAMMALITGCIFVLAFIVGRYNR